MMKLVVAVQDIKSGFDYVQIIDSDTVAIRSFALACEEQNTIFHRFANDFRLVQVGEFDTSTGELTAYPQASYKYLCNATDFVHGGEIDG